MNLYVGNLAWGVDDDSLRAFFESYGEVTAARVITDRETGRSRGFCIQFFFTTKRTINGGQ